MKPSEGLRQEYHKIEASLGYIARPCLKKERRIIKEESDLLGVPAPLT